LSASDGWFWALLSLWPSFQDRHPDAAHQIGDQIEGCDRQYREPSHANNGKQPKYPGLMEEFTALELKSIPAETFHETFNVVDSSRRIGHVPQEHARQQQGQIQHKVENQSNPKDAPRINMSQDASGSSNCSSFKGHATADRIFE
jgi:hypothetical protein